MKRQTRLKLYENMLEAYHRLVEEDKAYLKVRLKRGLCDAFKKVVGNRELRAHLTVLPELNNAITSHVDFNIIAFLGWWFYIDSKSNSTFEEVRIQVLEVAIELCKNSNEE